MGELKPLSGRGFGGGSNQTTETHTPVEDPNSLRSKATGRVVDAISEGQIYGLADPVPAKSIFLNSTPLQSQDSDVWNFSGVGVDYRYGTPDQGYMPGFPAAESEINVATECKYNQPVVRQIVNENVNAVRFTITVNSLFDQNTQTGDIHGTSVQLELAVRQSGQGWQTQVVTINGKQSGAYQQSYRLNLPGGTHGPWEVRVNRWTFDSDRSTLGNATVWSSYTEIIDHRLTYPNTAVIGLTFDASTFGSSIPSRTYDIKGLLIRIPNNFDPNSRTYGGTWDGGWKVDWTDDPAWIFYDLATNKRYGAGLEDSQVDRWSLYTISQYCNLYVPDGFGGSEPRFSCNVVINSRQEAYAVLNSLTSVFNGMLYWGSGAAMVVQDSPADPIALVTEANTLSGFEYSGVAYNAMHTVAVVSFLDKANSYETAVEVYEDPAAVAKWGWNPLEVTAFACTSRGQAHRTGHWLIDTEIHQGDTVTYQCSIDHANVVPGSIVEIADPAYMGLRAGGRVASATTTQIEIDAPYTFEGGQTYAIKVILQNGEVVQRNVLASPGPQTSLRLDTALPVPPLPETLWTLTASNLSPRLFRVISIQEDSSGTFSVTALFHDPNKYARIEYNLNLPPPTYSHLPDLSKISPPTNLRLHRDFVSTTEGWKSAITLDWDATPDPFCRGYVVMYQKNNGGWSNMGEVSGTEIVIYDGSGSYLFYVYAVNYAGIRSTPASLSVFIPDSSAVTVAAPSGLELAGQGNNTIFSTRDPKFDWNATAVTGAYAPGTETQVGQGYLDPNFRDYEIRIYDATNGQLIFTDHTLENVYIFTYAKNSATRGGPHRHFIFAVVVRDRWGNVSPEARLEVNNPPPAQVTDLQVQSGYGIVFVSFDKPTDEDYEGSIIWAGDATGFPPDDAHKVYDDYPTYAAVKGTPGQMIYIRVAAYDAFSKTELNVSSEIAIRVGGFQQDTIPPPIPTGLTLANVIATNADGTTFLTIEATWDASPAEDISLYGVAVSENGGGFVYFVADKGPAPKYVFTARAGSSYSVKVNARDVLGNISEYCAPVAITASADRIPPADPTGLTTTASFKTIWITWTNPADLDLDHIEIWEAAVNDRGQAARIGTPRGDSFARTGLNTGDARFYWIRAVDMSGNTSNYVPASVTGGIQATTIGTASADYQNLSIVNAAIANAAIDDAKIANISADKIKAGTILSGSVIVGDTGQTLDQIGQSGDPAAGVNAGTTLIDPGRILISGATTLADWRNGGDNTKIDGGNIAANTIAANALTIGNRNLTFAGLQFTANPSTSVVSWTAGVAAYIDDDGSQRTVNITAGSMPAFGQMRYIYWGKGRTVIDWDVDPSIAYRSDTVVLGTYRSGTDLIINWARTTIDGANIRTGSIVATNIAAGAITAHELASSTLITQTAQIQDAVITNAKIADATITTAKIHDLSADRITTGILTAGQVYVGSPYGSGKGFLVMEASGGMRRLSWWDTAGRFRAFFGQVGTSPNDSLDGLGVYDTNGNLIVSANGLGFNVVGSANIQDLSVQTLKIAGESVGVVRAATTFNSVNLDTGNNSHGGGGWQDYSIVSHQINVPYSSPVIVQFNMWTGSPPGVLTLDDTDPRFGNGPSWRFSRAAMYAGTGWNGGDFQCILRYKRDGGQLYQIGNRWQTGDRGGADQYGYPITYFETTPPASLVMVDYPGAGQHTYEIMASTGASGGQSRIYWDAASICTTTLMR